MMQRIKKTYQSKRVYRIEKAFQTEKYKLNLIEPTDPFLPDALNANTQRVEDVLINKMEGPVADLEQRVTVLESHKCAFGTYLGNGTYPRFIPLPFTPRYVFVTLIAKETSREFIGIAVDAEGGNTDAIQITDGGFTIQGDMYSPLNSHYNYGYLAFA